MKKTIVIVSLIVITATVALLLLLASNSRHSAMVVEDADVRNVDIKTVGIEAPLPRWNKC